MRKQKLHLFILAVLCAFSFTACKKREPVDLSSLHTTEAVTKETLPQSNPSETERVPESSVSPADSVNASSLKTEIQSEKIGDASVEYPVISNMKDSSKQEQVNALLKKNALAIADVHPDAELSVKASVEAVNLKRITVTYKGTIKNPLTSKAERIFYSNTIDLENIKNLGLSDFADIYTVAGYLVSGDYKLTDVTGNESAIRSSINASDKTTDYYYNKLQTTDFTGGYSADESQTPASDWPEIFSYEKQGVVYFSLPVSAEQGGYVLVHYSPDNK